MGCDIHFHSEVKIGGEWHHYSEEQCRRDYRLFAKMANVRNEDRQELIHPIALPRGLPKDASYLTKFMSDNDGIDGHSHSYLDAEEISDLEDWVIKHLLDDDPMALESRYWGYFFGNTWGGFFKYPDSRPEGIQSVRFVFWFDN